MTEQTTRRFRTTLVEEINIWKQEGLITPEISETLLLRYPVLAQSSRAVTILLIVGAVLVGLGMLLFVCANWEHMARISKLAVLVGSMLASYIGAWHCKYEPGERPKLGSALLLLGALLYGANIWLVSQIFNFDTTLSNGLAAWSAGVAALTLLTRSKSLVIFLSLLVAAWNFSTAGLATTGILDFHLQPASLVTFLISMVVTAKICSYCRSNAALYVLLIAGLIWTFTVSSTLWAGAVIYGALLFASYLWLRDHSRAFANPMLYVGTVSALLGCYLATFDKYGASIEVMQHGMSNLTIMFAITLIVCTGIAMSKTVHQMELIGCLGFSIAGALISLFATDFVRLGLTNLMLASLMAALIAAGMRLQKAALVNISIVFIVLDIIARYFDMFFSTMDRSIFFVLGGLILIGAGSIAERNRRKLMGSFS